ncbi:MAG: glycoside hydrolase family 43 protein [Treponema sp.]|jgi:GH43 family beta-xylosidase|nr:glycoside hydrolase family 43 protein [Treponema sp.]
MRISDIQIRDPFVILEDNRYYLFGSTDKDIWKGPAAGFDVYVSEGDLTAFEGPFPVFRPPEDFWSRTNFWAPEIHRYRGSYYMFATFKPREGRRGTAILKSASGIMGPYLPWSLNAEGGPGPVTPADWECLDGTFFVEQGKPYMVFCHEWRQAKDGQICAIPLTEDLRQAAYEGGGGSGAWPRVLFRASEAPWACELAGRSPGSYVTDGPFLYLARNGVLFMSWSSFGRDGNYCTGIARSEGGSLKGPWIQSGEPLYKRNGGHGMLFRGKNGMLYLAIHAPNKTPLERAVFVKLAEFELREEIKGYA